MGRYSSPQPSTVLVFVGDPAVALTMNSPPVWVEIRLLTLVWVHLDDISNSRGVHSWSIAPRDRLNRYKIKTNSNRILTWGGVLDKNIHTPIR